MYKLYHNKCRPQYASIEVCNEWNTIFVRVFIETNDSYKNNLDSFCSFIHKNLIKSTIFPPPPPFLVYFDIAYRQSEFKYALAAF